ncbi:aldo/keto reductase [Flavobacterium sp. HSC-61S13]|uniref:aldo/keto reductase n=1 Tax=Flavobacterium sp. HSC-61S13 TaxID=2910963 RepID=UPI00209E3181|nr:aldo/keto reductase [Flavobacterium sp. HSC-61S13]MCP1997508.1 aryl-alcohol dehydrogenase-like predicted oxidoreductase [Flavobacterium sp. HSC-61S13]
MSDKIKFGKSDLLVAPVSFGGNVFGWTLDEKESFRMLDALVDNGLNFIDTANNYSYWVPQHRGGESEEIIGKWFKQSRKRNQIVLATKVGGQMGDGSKGLKAAYIRLSIEASLKRLQTDHIDLYQSHYDDLETGQEETMEVYNQLIREGKVRFIGASNLEPQRILTSNQIARANNWAEYISVQPLYNLYDRAKFENEYLPIVQEGNLAVMSYFALASGFLSGKYRTEQDLEGSKRKDMVKGYLNERGLRILDALEKVADQYQLSMATVATAWQINKPEITTPIVSATNSTQLKDIIKAMELKLTSEDRAVLDQASSY